MQKLKPFLEMMSLYGLEEIKGSKHEPLILDMFKNSGYAGIEDDETAWCAAAMNSAAFLTGFKTSGKLTARSFMDSQVTKRIETPYLGCVVCFWRGKPDGWQGHVGFWIREDKKYVYCLGGNQSNSLRISKYPKARLLGYRELIFNGEIEGVTETGVEVIAGLLKPEQLDAISKAYKHVTTGMDLLDRNFDIK